MATVSHGRVNGTFLEDIESVKIVKIENHIADQQMVAEHKLTTDRR
jgi:hypothetical protein